MRALLGSFRVDAPIASGGMGRVLRAHAIDGTGVAIKVVDVPPDARARALASFTREVRAIAALDHPGIVRVLDHGVVDEAAAQSSEGMLTAGMPFLAMELAWGTLHSHRLPPEWSAVRAVLLTLLDALGHAHARGIVHRDLKPANVLRIGDPRGTRCLLTDFGLAWIAHGDEETSGRAAGTPWYMAPEQFRGAARDFGPPTDLYALGCLAWELVAGHPPFPSRDDAELVRMHLDHSPPPLSPRFAVPRGLERWLRALLAKAPGSRPTHAVIAAHALRGLGDAEARAFSTPLPPLAPWDQAATTETGSRSELSSSASSDPSENPFALAASLLTPPPLPELPTEAMREGSAPPGVGLALLGLRAAPLIGRGDVCASLWSTLREVEASRRPRAVLIESPAGMGKSRLIDWLLTRAHEAGCEVLRVLGSPTPDPTAGLAAMVSRTMGTTGLARDAAFLRLERRAMRDGFDLGEAIALCDLLHPPLDPSTSLVPTQEARMALVLRLVARVARDRVLVLAIDDAQWTDEAVQLAELVLEEALPVLIAVGARTGEGEPELPRRLRTAATVTTLSPLSKEASERLAREWAGLAPDAARAVAERASGNPLVLTQLLRAFAESGDLLPTPEGFVLSARAESTIPDDTYALWSQRIDRVLAGATDAERLALDLLAIGGVRVREREWRRACASLRASIPWELEARLEPADLARVEDDAGEKTIVFVHALLSATLERRATEAGRARALHDAWANALIASGSADAERLALHLFAAGRHEEALGPLRAAAREQVARAQHRQAELLLAKHLASADALGLPPEHEERIVGALELASVLRERGALAEARQHADSARDAAARAGLETLAARAATLAGSIAIDEGELARAAACFADARVRYERLEDAVGTARALRGEGRVHAFRAERNGTNTAYRRALELAEQAGDHAGVAAALHGLARIDLRGPEAAAHLAAAASAYETARDPEGHASALADLGDLSRAAGELDEAEASYASALAKARTSRVRSSVLARLASLHMQRERWDEARTPLRDALRSALKVGEARLVAEVSLAALTMAAHDGDLDAWDGQASVAMAYFARSDVADAPAAEALEAAASLIAARSPARAASALELAASKWDALGDAERAARTRASAENVLAAVASHH